MEAEFVFHNPPFIHSTPRLKGRRGAGMKYEGRAHEHMERTVPGYAPAPWVRFRSRVRGGGVSEPRWCQPDGIILDLRAGKITLVEFKLQHTSLAWWQLRLLYEPVVKAIFGTDRFDYAVLEVVHWMDPHVAFPERYAFVSHPQNVPPTGFGVHVYSAR